MAKFKKELINRCIPLNVFIGINLSEIAEADKKTNADELVHVFAKILQNVLSFSPLLKVTDDQDNSDVVMTVSVTEQGKIQMRTQYADRGHTLDGSTDAIGTIAPEDVEGYLYRIAYAILKSHEDHFFELAREKYMVSKRVTHCNYDYKVINEVKACGDDKLAKVSLAYEEVLNNLVRKAAEADKEKPASDLSCEITIRIIHDPESPKENIVVQLEKKAPAGYFHELPVTVLNISGYSSKVLNIMGMGSISPYKANLRQAIDKVLKGNILERLQKDHIVPMNSLGLGIPIINAAQTTHQWAGIIELSFRNYWPRQLEEVKEVSLLPLEATMQDAEPVLFVLPESRPFVFVLNEVDSLPPETNMFMEELRKLYALPCQETEPVVFKVNVDYQEGIMIQVCYKDWEIFVIKISITQLASESRESICGGLDALQKACIVEAIAPFLMQRAGQTVENKS